MLNKKYVHRIIEKELSQRALEFPVVVLTGARQTGKSTLLKKIFSKHKYVSLDNPLDKKLAITDPETFLENNSAPVIIDEIQYAPQLLPYIKIRVDKNRAYNGGYIITGSQMFPLMQGVSESLAGRAVLYELLGFSFSELSLRKNSLSMQGCYKLLFQGFFPEVCVHKADTSSFFNSYVQTYLERDIRQVKAVHDLNVFQDFLELLAVRAGNLLNLNEISKECGASATSMRNWLSILEVSRMVYLLRPFSKNISKRVVKSPKIYFTDTGLLSYILRYPSAEILLSGPSAGVMFENFIVLEILKYKFNYNQRFEIYFYRDSNHQEVDVVIDFGYKKVLVEIKKTATLKERHWKALRKIADYLKVSESYLISNYSEEMYLDEKVKHLPWRQLFKIFS